ncbi:HAD-IIB family hydrolase [Candidatus Pantoea persica]|uniref:HAD-IIB family hydrolase n=1 Tax=Candidatus Pantoea persica TaxID=2518128 RepID=UPI0035A93A3F|nr:mannosyl-3-phosphoglycerate phosphatase [Candidatus Pantoea persica]
MVLCSNKTAAEIALLQKRLGLAGMPFIAENGAAVRAHSAGQRRLRRALSDAALALQAHFRLQGFYDFTDTEVAAMTGLTESESALARHREASEVIVWCDEEEKLEAFRAALAQGGRFWHVMPAGSGKGEALRWLFGQYEHPPVTLGLGDGPNDAPMLDAVDFAVVIKGYSKTPVTLARADTQQVYHTAYYGPEGWKEGLDYFLTSSS